MSPSSHLHYCLNETHPLWMFCSLQMPSRQGFTFLPSTSSPQSPQRGEEPGFPVGLELGCGSEPAFTGTDPGWARPRGEFSNPPFPHISHPGFTVQAQPSTPLGLCLIPSKPDDKPGSLSACKYWPLAACLFPDPQSLGLGFPCQHPSSAPGCGCWHRAHAQPSLPPGVSCHRALTVWKSLLLQSSLPNVQRTSISPMSSW